MAKTEAITIQNNLRLAPETHNKFKKLCALMGMREAMVATIAIDRMYREEVERIRQERSEPNPI